MRLQDKVVVVTGAGRGLGKEIALLFGREGGKIVVAAPALDEIQDTAREVNGAGGVALSLLTDVTDRAQVRELFREVDRAFGRLDILVNNAGVGIFRPFTELTPEDIEAMVNINLKGTMYCSQEAFLRMRSAGGHIINVVSTAGKVGRAMEAGYCASKWGVAGLTECLKEEGRPLGIRVTAFCPGGMNTSFWQTPNGRRYQRNPENLMDPKAVASILLEIVTLPPSIVVDDIVIRRA